MHKTPLYSHNRICLLQTEANDTSLKVENIGQIELAPFGLICVDFGNIMIKTARLLYINS